jgi:hypothetical protein
MRSREASMDKPLRLVTKEEVDAAAADRKAKASPKPKPPREASRNTLPASDFIAFSPDHTYVHRATGETWTSTAVNARVMPVKIGGDKEELAANVWLDRNDAVEQRT